jgi:ParB-like chromosome segregation protein Spo0J
MPPDNHLEATTMDVPFAQYEQVAVADLLPYARNARKHPPEQVAEIAASIKEFGFIAPCVIWSDNTLIAGHGRILAAQKLGL